MAITGSTQKIVVAGYGGPDRLASVSEVVPAPGVGDVRIRVEASSAVYTDTLIRRGLYPDLRRRRAPLDLGYDMVVDDVLADHLKGRVRAERAQKPLRAVRKHADVALTELLGPGVYVAGQLPERIGARVADA